MYKFRYDISNKNNIARIIGVSMVIQIVLSIKHKSKGESKHTGINTHSQNICNLII